MLFDTLIFGLTLYRIVIDGSREQFYAGLSLEFGGSNDRFFVASTKRNRLIKVLFRDGQCWFCIRR